MEPFAGSVEILTQTNQSVGIPGVRWTPEAVPDVIGPVAGVTDLVTVTPQERARRLPVAEWTGTDGTGQPVAVLLWRQVPEDLNGPFVGEREGGD